MLSKKDLALRICDLEMNIEYILERLDEIEKVTKKGKKNETKK